MTELLEILASTWPPVRVWQQGPVTLRDGAGGGKRVEAASCDDTLSPEQLDAAERAMDAEGQRALFVVRPDQAALDKALAARGYLVLDPTMWLSCEIATIDGAPDPVSAFTVWPPLQVQREIWAGGGVGPERIAIMQRASAPKTAILGRWNDKPAGTAFVALHGECAVVHALEVSRAARRLGLATQMMKQAARWGERQGATRIGCFVTEANRNAIALYRGLGMEGARCYHYRVRP